MIILDIINNIGDIEIGNYLTIIFQNNYNIQIDDTNPFSIFSSTNHKQQIDIKIIEFLGKGSFGVVFKFEYENNLYALKLNSNEIPSKLHERYASLLTCKKIKKYFIDIYCCGNINSNKFKYFSIMQFGGYSLKIKNCIYDRPILYHIIFQLIDIVYNVIKYKILLPDFKLNNLTIDQKYNIKIIDFYIYCDDYVTCKNCTIIKTYAPVEMQTHKNIFDKSNSNPNTSNHNYNYTYICLPFIFCLIDLLCKHKSDLYIQKLAKKFNITNNSNAKEIINMIQISSFYYNKFTTNTTNFEQYYNKVNIYKKLIEDKFPFIKSETFYEYFLNIIHIKDEYSEFITRQHFLLLINDFINLDPNKRALNMMFELLKIIKPEKKYKYTQK
jgi:hypothetical protein